MNRKVALFASVLVILLMATISFTPQTPSWEAPKPKPHLRTDIEAVEVEIHFQPGTQDPVVMRFCHGVNLTAEKCNDLAEYEDVTPQEARLVSKTPLGGEFFLDALFYPEQARQPIRLCDRRGPSPSLRAPVTVTLIAKTGQETITLNDHSMRFVEAEEDYCFLAIDFTHLLEEDNDRHL